MCYSYSITTVALLPIDSSIIPLFSLTLFTGLHSCRFSIIIGSLVTFHYMSIMAFIILMHTNTQHHELLFLFLQNNFLLEKGESLKHKNTVCE